MPASIPDRPTPGSTPNRRQIVHVTTAATAALSLPGSLAALAATPATATAQTPATARPFDPAAFGIGFASVGGAWSARSS